MRDATKLRIYFNDDKALFLIPLYQRKYAWQKKHCQRLFSDLQKIHEKNITSHFFGSIVSVKASETENDLLIIDGQQRITTISILILAAINAVKNGLMTCESEEFLKDTMEKYLFAKYRRHVERKIKLRPIDDDLKAYDALFTNDKEQFVPADKSGITNNYLFFYNLITGQGHPLVFEDLIESIERLIIIDICLDSKDNPQLIFESLNSCGKDLEEADKVRNYLLMSQSKELQEQYYYNYWRKIEQATDGEPTMFIRDYLTLKNKVISNIEELYFDFKTYDETNNISREELLADMCKYAKYYRMVDKGETDSPKLNRKLHQLGSIGSYVCMPFYLAFFNYADENNLSEQQRYEVLDVVENYWARRMVCGWPANYMTKSFANLHGDIMRIFKAHQKRGVEVEVPYVEVMKYIILKKQGTGVFPSDLSVKESFPQRQIYKIPASYRAFLFERMENLDSKEADESIIQKMNDGKISIEHIMPQHLTSQWKQELGEDAERIHEQYLHTFANLTLTGYNIDYSNRPYIDKWNGYTYTKKDKETKEEKIITVYGYKDSAFKLSNYMKLHQKWTEAELKERGELLLSNFLKLWPMITSQYQPLDREVEIVSLDDDDTELKGRSIVAFSYKGVKHDVWSWKMMLVEVCKLVFAEYPSEMLYLATKDYNLHPKEQSNYTKIADNCYVWSSNDTRTKRAVLAYIFKEIGILPSDLELMLVPINENTVIDNVED